MVLLKATVACLRGKFRRQSRSVFAFAIRRHAALQLPTNCKSCTSAIVPSVCPNWKTVQCHLLITWTLLDEWWTVSSTRRDATQRNNDTFWRLRRRRRPTRNPQVCPHDTTVTQIVNVVDAWISLPVIPTSFCHSRRCPSGTLLQSPWAPEGFLPGEGKWGVEVWRAEAGWGAL